MSSHILSVTYEIDAMTHKDGHFSIPKKISDLLGLRSDDFVHLIITHPSGGHLFSGKWQMKSGNEIYGQDIAERIKSGQRIRVSVSRP